MKRVAQVSILVFVLDQLSKLVVVQWIDLKAIGFIDVIPSFVSFRMAWNQGVNFGLFANGAEVMRWVLIGIAVAVSIWLFRWAASKTHWSAAVFGGCVIGGALGNAIDRIVYGAVADFLNVTCCGINNPYAFNVADIEIFIGAFGLVLFSNKLDNSG